MSDLWWYAPPKHGLVHFFQLALGTLILLLLLPVALMAALIDARRKP